MTWLNLFISNISPMCCRTLQTLVTASRLTPPVYTRCYLPTFLTTATFDSSFFKLLLKFFISSVSEFVISLVCYYNFKNSLISWVLFNALIVCSVYIAVILPRNITMIQNSFNIIWIWLYPCSFWSSCSACFKFLFSCIDLTICSLIFSNAVYYNTFLSCLLFLFL